MLVNIIPAIRLPRTTEFYSYSVPADLTDKIKIGQIIEINFRNKNIQGLVIKIDKNKKSKYKLKEINKILYPQPLVTASQIKLIDYLVNYYAATKSIVVKSMLPEVPKKHKNTENTKTQKTLARQTQSEQKHKDNKKLFWYQDENKLIDELKKICNSGLQTEKQILILVPEIEIINKLINKLELSENNVIKNYAGLAKIKFFNAWLDILSGQAKIIIGTKISVLLPFSNLSDIIIYNEHDWNHKQSDINPRFDARKVAEWLARAHGCNLTLATPAPSVETYHTRALKHESIKTNINIKTIDLKQEKLKGNYTFLSDELIYNIKASLAENKQIFIFHNRKGLANFVSCSDCGYIFKCPECEISLVYHVDDKKLHCHHCNYNQDSLPLCPNCQGPNIKFKGQGVDRIKSELQKEFSDVKILTLEKKSNKLNEFPPKADPPLAEKSLKKYNIIIGTEFVINKIDFDQFNLIAFSNFDQLLNHPEFRSQERAYQIFYEIKSQAPRADFIIQTYGPENIVLKSIQQNKPELFYASELNNRQELNYPPFIKIIKLICQDKKEKNVIYNTKKLALKLKEIKNIEILGPFENYPKKVFNKYKYNIIIKAPVDFDIKKIIRLVPNDFVIDVEPKKLN